MAAPARREPPVDSGARDGGIEHRHPAGAASARGLPPDCAAAIRRAMLVDLVVSASAPATCPALMIASDLLGDPRPQPLEARALDLTVRRVELVPGRAGKGARA
jgi:hypothetical protein